MSMVLYRLVASLRGRLVGLRHLGWYEIRLLVVALVVLSCTYLFIRLADEVEEGDTQKFDERVLRSLRRADDPAVPIGPPWLREAGLDITALGSPAVLVLVTASVVGFMLLQRKYALVLLTLLATSGGVLLSFLVKEMINRDRPTVVPHLREVSTPSFPSGHALLSAVVYLTLATLLMHTVRGRLLKLYCLAWAMFLTFLVGISRIYLGVHYPTDVLAGWMVGLAWALLCWLVAQYLRRQGVIEESEGRGPPEEPVA
jgi:undecaprenyl-diphosphatase